MNEQEELKMLRARNESLSGELAQLAYVSIFIFGIPAIGVYFVGAYLNTFIESKALVYLPLFAIAFALSIYIFMRSVNAITITIKKIEDRIRTLVEIVEPKELHD